LDIKDRKCHDCGEGGHISRNCPKKKTGIRAIEDGSVAALVADALDGIFAVTSEGFSPAKKPFRPAPRGWTIGDAITPVINRFKVLEEKTAPSSTVLCGIAPSPVDNGHDDLWPELRALSVATVPGSISLTASSVAKLPGNNYIDEEKAMDEAIAANALHPSVPAPHPAARPARRGKTAFACSQECCKQEAEGQVNKDEAEGSTPEASPCCEAGPKSPDEWARLIMADIQEAESIGKLETEKDHEQSGFWKNERVNEINELIKKEHEAVVGCIEDDYQLIAAATEVVKIRVAMDSAATDNVIPPGELPEDVLGTMVENTSGKHFVGANNAHIQKYGQVETILQSKDNKISCAFQAADVNRALHSVAKVCGPKGAGNAKQDVLFDNDVCVVVPPGVVKAILKRLKPVMQYEREGDLYIADLELSSFHRQGQHA